MVLSSSSISSIFCPTSLRVIQTVGARISGHDVSPLVSRGIDGCGFASMIT
ncbi:unnamed protein product [Prunus brigantina]